MRTFAVLSLAAIVAAVRLTSDDMTNETEKLSYQQKLLNAGETKLENLETKYDESEWDCPRIDELRDGCGDDCCDDDCCDCDCPSGSGDDTDSQGGTDGDDGSGTDGDDGSGTDGDDGSGTDGDDGSGIDGDDGSGTGGDDDDENAQGGEDGDDGDDDKTDALDDTDETTTLAQYECETKAKMAA